MDFTNLIPYLINRENFATTYTETQYNNAIKKQQDVDQVIMNNALASQQAGNTNALASQQAGCIQRMTNALANQRAVTNSQPVDTNIQPVDTNIQPVDTNSQPVDTNSQPVDTNSQPVDTNSQLDGVLNMEQTIAILFIVLIIIGMAYYYFTSM